MELPVSSAILFTAAFVQGFLGFGFGIIAMGGLSLGAGVWHAAGVVNLAALVQTTTTMLILRRHVLWPLVRRVVIGSVIGVPLGLYLLDTLDLAVLQLGLGLLIAAVAAWNLSPWRPVGAPSPRWDTPVGLVSGLLNGLFNTGGPPLVAHIYRRPEHPDVLRATVHTLFVFTLLVRTPGAWLQGMLPAAVWREAGVAAAFVLMGTLLGIVLGRRVDPARFRRISWVALGLLGLWIAWVS